MSRTIEVEFDENELPQWARKDAYVVWLCKRDLAFRIAVQSAETAIYKQLLKRVAQQIFNAK